MKDPGSPNRYFSKHAKGSPLTSKEKRIILNVYASLRKENPDYTREEVQKMTAEYTGVSVNSVFKIKSEFKKNGIVVTNISKRTLYLSGKPKKDSRRKTASSTKTPAIGVEKAKAQDAHEIIIGHP